MAALLSVGAGKQAQLFVDEALSDPEYHDARKILGRVIMRQSAHIAR